ncbi:sulfotransferase family 2 domain-containing protein [Capilliphycus salinus ALCB114379]|uniref:sulfotransferase family 2 domain-containing protein n=1 Tax=Capilliphycus salinus TaxID=2768948 RepID=UPI0039A5D377
MTELNVLNDSSKYYIELEENSRIYLRDDQGYITKERYPWIDQLIGVRQVKQGYEVLFKMKRGDYAKFFIDSSGLKQKRQNIDIKSIDQVSADFQVDLRSGHHPKPNQLIVHCSYHKVATTFFSGILRRVAKDYGWNFQKCKQQELHSETDIFFQQHSKVNFSQLPSYVGSHIIRDPRDMIISGYFYHLWCSEEWCHKKKQEYGNKSYQELLNSLSKDEGIKAEINRMANAIKNMVNWDYSNPNIVEIRL